MTVKEKKERKMMKKMTSKNFYKINFRETQAHKIFTRLIFANEEISLFCEKFTRVCLKFAKIAKICLVKISPNKVYFRPNLHRLNFKQEATRKELGNLSQFS